MSFLPQSARVGDGHYYARHTKHGCLTFRITRSRKPWRCAVTGRSIPPLRRCLVSVTRPRTLRMSMEGWELLMAARAAGMTEPFKGSAPRAERESDESGRGVRGSAERAYGALCALLRPYEASLTVQRRDEHVLVLNLPRRDGSAPKRAFAAIQLRGPEAIVQLGVLRQWPQLLDGLPASLEPYRCGETGFVFRRVNRKTFGDLAAVVERAYAKWNSEEGGRPAAAAPAPPPRRGRRGGTGD